eukprot:PhM_4_TR14533/c0_g2_i1/m.18462
MPHLSPSSASSTSHRIDINDAESIVSSKCSDIAREDARNLSRWYGVSSLAAAAASMQTPVLPTPRPPPPQQQGFSQQAKRVLSTHIHNHKSPSPAAEPWSDVVKDIRKAWGSEDRAASSSASPIVAISSAIQQEELVKQLRRLNERLKGIEDEKRIDRESKAKSRATTTKIKKEKPIIPSSAGPALKEEYDYFYYPPTNSNNNNNKHTRSSTPVPVPVPVPAASATHNKQVRARVTQIESRTKRLMGIAERQAFALEALQSGLHDVHKELRFLHTDLVTGEMRGQRESAATRDTMKTQVNGFYYHNHNNHKNNGQQKVRSASARGPPRWR